MTDTSALARWLQDQHLTDEAIRGYRSEFEAHPARFVVIRDLLQPQLAERLSEFLLNEAEYQPEYGLYSVEDGKVEANDWAAAPDDDRFFRFEKLVGTPPQFQLSDSSLAYLRFRTMFQRDDDLRSYFEAVTGLELARSDDFGSHLMRAGDFLKSHDDNNRNRRLALVLYLSPAWRSEYGGALQIVDKSRAEFTVSTEFNSLVAFDTMAETTHYVVPIRGEAGEQTRVTIGGWYHSR